MTRTLHPLRPDRFRTAAKRLLPVAFLILAVGWAPTQEPASEIVDEGGETFVRGASLNDTFQYLAQQAGFQFFHNADLEGPTFLVTGHLHAGDPIKQMEELGLMYGVSIYQKGSTVYALTQAQVMQLPQRPMQYHLNYLRPGDIDQIKAMLQPVLTPGTGSMEYETKTNTLIVYDNEQKLSSIAEILAEMDRPKNQIAIETRILRIKSSSLNRIGVDWQTVLGDGLSVGAIASLNSLFNLPDIDTVRDVVTMTKEVTGLLESSRDGLTTRDGTSSFNSTAKKVTGSLEKLKDGLTISNDGSSAFDGDNLSTEAGSLHSSLINGNKYKSVTDTSKRRTVTRDIQRTESGLVLSPLQINAVIRALNTGNLAQQESSPTLITEDNEEALISIIDRIPIITTTISQTDVGQNITEEVRYRIDPDDPVQDPILSREIGVTISVTPSLLPDDTIRMLLRPRSAQIIEFLEGQTGNLYPRVNESTIQTIARVPDGHSLMIGGVYEVIESDVTSKVPLVGDIPIVNLLFKSTERAKEHTSLVFIVTPTSYEPVSTADSDGMTRHLHDMHILPRNHAEPDPSNPGFNYESRPFRTIGNLFKAHPRTPPTSTLHPDHRTNAPPLPPSRIPDHAVSVRRLLGGKNRRSK